MIRLCQFWSQYIDEFRRYHDEVEEIHKHEEQIHREIDQVKSYTDSRIDKVVSSGTLKSSKRQILNG